MASGPHTLLFPIYRDPALTREQFQRHYLEVHVPIAERLPGLILYETFVSHEPEVPGEPARPDAFAVMGYTNADAFKAAAESDVYREAVADNAGLVGSAEAFRVAARRIRG